MISEFNEQWEKRMLIMTVTAVVKQVEGDKYPTSSLVLSFMNYQCMSVSNMYVKTSGRTWRIGGSQI
jgi:hypothetical protein